jgi:hypothetical protein
LGRGDCKFQIAKCKFKICNCQFAIFNLPGRHSPLSGKVGRVRAAGKRFVRAFLGAVVDRCRCREAAQALSLGRWPQVREDAPPQFVQFSREAALEGLAIQSRGIRPETMVGEGDVT